MGGVLFSMHNIVFGCPKSRNGYSRNKDNRKIAVNFFKRLGRYADEHNVKIGIEANPEIYGTDFLNKTNEVIDFIREVDSPGIGLNLDIGAVIYNCETIEDIGVGASFISHVHISEPNMLPIRNRKIHQDLLHLLKKIKYDKYVSLEMKDSESLETVEKSMMLIKDVFG